MKLAVRLILGNVSRIQHPVTEPTDAEITHEWKFKIKSSQCQHIIKYAGYESGESFKQPILTDPQVTHFSCMYSTCHLKVQRDYLTIDTLYQLSR